MTNQQMEVASLIEVARALQITGSVIERLAKALCVDRREAPCGEPVLTESNSALSPHSVTIANAVKREGSDGWPRIGGHDFIPPAPDAFMTAEYAKRYSPGKPRIIYVAACKGLKSLSDATRIPQNKVSTSAPDRLQKRLRELGKLKYGSLYLNAGKYVEEDGFDNWKTYCPPISVRRLTNSPVSVKGGALTVIMPASMSARGFDGPFDDLVQRGRVSFCSSSGQAQTWGCPSTSYASRFTNRKRSSGIETEASKEIVVFRRFGDFDRLVSIIERVVLDHLGL